MKPRLKIFVDAHVFDGEFQGTRTFIREIYQVLAGKADLQLYIAARNVDALEKTFDQKENIVFIRYKTRSSMLRLLFEIPWIIRHYRIDYAHFQYICPPVKPCRFIVSTHDVIFDESPREFSFLYRKVKRILYRYAAHKADILTTVSAFSKQSIARFLGVPKEKIQVVPNAVSEHFFKPYNRKNYKQQVAEKYGFRNFILYVSRIEPRKNHISLLKAFLDLRLYERHFHLLFLGNKTMPVSSLDAMIHALPENVKPFVVSRNDVHDEELATFYRSADLFVYPSKAEGFGIPPLEAGASRVPVICSNAGALQEFSFFERDAVDPRDQEALNEKMKEVLYRPHDEDYLAGIADTIKNTYCWKASAEKLYQLILRDQLNSCQ